MRIPGRSRIKRILAGSPGLRRLRKEPEPRSAEAPPVGRDVAALREGLEALQKRLVALEQAQRAQTEKLDQLLWLQSLQRLAQTMDFDLGVDTEDASRLATMRFVDAVYELELQRRGPELRRALEVAEDANTRMVRGAPSEPPYLSSGYYKTMLKRYIFAGKVFGERRRILDTCCGRGWGASILSLYADSLVAFDYAEEVVQECRRTWHADNIEWICGNALDRDLLAGEQFDLVTGMEVIEHFRQPEGVTYLEGCMDRLRPGGHFVGTSFFPRTRHQADHHQSLKQPDHHYLWTMDELREVLGRWCDGVWIIDQWMVIGRRAVNPR